MRLNIFWIILLLCYGNFANAQHETGFQIDSRQDSVRLYYHNINRAEIAIIDSNYNLATEYYKSARIYKWLNAEDLYNATICSYLEKDTVTAVDYLGLLAKYGLKRSHLEAYRWGKSVIDEPFL